MAGPGGEVRRGYAQFSGPAASGSDLTTLALSRAAGGVCRGCVSREFAILAGLSVDWYVPVENGRDHGRLRQSLECLARAMHARCSSRVKPPRACMGWRAQGSRLCEWWDVAQRSGVV